MIAASSPGPIITRSPTVGNVRRCFALERYEQCSLQRFKKQPSSTGFGGRFSRSVMILRSDGGSRDMVRLFVSIWINVIWFGIQTGLAHTYAVQISHLLFHLRLNPPKVTSSTWIRHDLRVTS